MAGAADADSLMDNVPVKIAFVFAVVMPCSGNEVVPRECLEPSADWALAVHDLDSCFYKVCIGWLG